ncbi:peptidoglycan-binding domain-containing protein [Aestuariivirga sp. YIM B02566]|uniref:Peptidoglycan-binding protein n=1 Tax=Taklimakanibacter albus TaxID=2800327 RepID=A0ACC5RBL4_9HYPH|nr:peptidoglycan-binding domain-containing protein [Aestuariivirga sp. YIM B02566]MBK1870015.1 peptidoglycan-binding protein [Aestuariivirga sp. YIM B02566]
MSNYEEDDAPRLGVSTIVVALTVAVLSVAIVYNTLTQSAPPATITQDEASEPDPITGSTRVTVDAGSDDQGGTVTLRYDATIESVQRELAASGLYSGQVDGVSGRRTKLAIIAYQRANGLDETGQASTDLIEHIRYTRQINEAVNMTDAGTTAPRATAPSVKPVDTVTRVQVGLAELGYEPGAINGQLGQQTRNAILKFERDRGIAPTGDISSTLIAELDKMSARSAN